MRDKKDSHMLDPSTILKKFRDAHLLIMGDLMIDEYIWGRVERISPEAPVQVLEVREENLTPGGAGNVVKNILSLGGKVDVLGVVGDDKEGIWLKEKLRELGAGIEGIIAVEGRPTTRKTRIMAGTQQILRIDRETRDEIGSSLVEKFISFLKSDLEKYDAVLISDYAKGFLSKKLLSLSIPLIKEKGIPVLVDPKGKDFKKYTGATMITPNQKEAAIAVSGKVSDENNVGKLGALLLKELDLDAIIITQGKDGLTLFKKNGAREYFPTVCREVFDVSGAGDTVLAVMGLACGTSIPLEEGARLANLAAGIVVGKVGTATVSPIELIQAMSQHETILCASGKVRSAQDLLNIVNALKATGKRVIFTNGCFDILHVGHIELLKNAKELGDILIVGLNSDASVKRLKGSSRPIIPENQRAKVLGSLSFVDYITIFDEDTPLSLIQLLKPDVLVKGADYKPNEVVGRDVVESYGGEVVLLPLTDGVSTTKVIEKINRSHK